MVVSIRRQGLQRLRAYRWVNSARAARVARGFCFCFWLRSCMLLNSSAALAGSFVKDRKHARAILPVYLVRGHFFPEKRLG